MTSRLTATTIIGAATLALTPVSRPLAEAALAPATAGASVDAAFGTILADARVKKALDDIKADDARTLEEQKRIAQIPSPPFKETARAGYYVQRLRELGFADAKIDPEGNVIALRKGAGRGPTLVVSAHLDTVFSEGTDLTMREENGTIRAPGIGDDARGLAALLSAIKALDANGLKTVGDVLFVGTVGEEELGNLRGVKALFREHAEIDGFISVDGIDVRRIVNRATGSHRFEMIFRGPGGHSFAEFGLPSAIHAMGRAIAAIDDLETPAEPKTTFTVGTVRGGTSVNAIASEARMAVDMRSNATAELDKIEARVMAAVKGAVAAENKRWNSDKITVDIKMIGDRPAGSVPDNSPVVEVARRSIAAVTGGTGRITLAGASTDSNVAMSLSLPAVTISGGGEGGNWHSTAEWYKPTEAYLGPQNVLLTTLALVGVDGLTAPLLPARPQR